ncbi:hypothetical protein VNO77_44577 [Canavalia gladiata]|uniref:ENTH domain-containing protein n=1 Tax=Canavalia gladiata TaxID=3824 RepID=A0AAN9JYB9_CANGL
MPSKLRKAIGAVKDQTSISLAKVTNAANLEVTILKATTHDKNPIEERYVNEIVNVVSSNKVYAAACAHCIGKRIGKTRNWIVALKSLMIVLRIFQDGDPYFPREVFHAMKRGAKILNLSSFKDDSNSSPWDYTAFIRTFALYLDERLDCFLTGKLQRRFTYHNLFHEKKQRNKLSDEPGIKDMKPTLVLDRIPHWQTLLDRAIGTRPTGSAKTNRLVQISLYSVVQESFDLYRDISDGLAVVLDSFFHLPLSACVSAFNACVKSYKQFDELSAFYSFCANNGIGRSYEYPRVQKVSDELMETLREFLKDQTSIPTANGSKRFLSPVPKHFPGSSSSQDEAGDRYGTLERFFESGSDFGSQSTSLEDLMSATDAALSPRRSHEQDIYSSEQSDQDEKESQSDYASATGSDSTKSLPIDQTSRSSLDILSFDELQQQMQQNQTNEWDHQNTKPSSNNSSKDCWELVLAKTVTAPSETSSKLANEFDPFVNFFCEASGPQHKYNPFLDDTQTVAPLDVFDAAPTFKATTTTFNDQDPLPSTLFNQCSSSITDLDLFFGDMNPNETPMETTFKDQGFSAGTNMIVPPTFHTKTCDNWIATPNFLDAFSFNNDSTPTFQVHNSNVDATTDSSIYFTPQNHNFSIVPLHFQAENFDDSIMPPTFSAMNFNGTTLTTPIEDDPFGPWPSANTNEQTLNVSMQEENLLQQQQLWLEQQNKIIAKHLT